MELARIKLGIDASPARKGGEEAKGALVEVRQEAQRTGKGIEALEKRIKQLEKEAVDSAHQMHGLKSELDGATRSAERLDRASDKLSAAADKLGKNSERAAKKVDKVADAEKRAAEKAFELKVAATTAAVALASLLVIGDVVEDLVRFERGLVGVGKTADITGDALDRMGDRVIGLSLDTGTVTDKILEVSQVAGQLGIKGADNILKFTDTLIKLEKASAGTLAGEEGATNIARILNVTGESTDSVEELANVIVALGNNMAATEGEIAHHANQVALATAAYDVSASEAAAYGAVLASLGVRAELSGSAIGRTVRALDEAVRTGGPALQTIQRITGLTGQQVTDLFDESQLGLLQRFIEGLGFVASQGGDTTAALEALGLQGEEILKVLPTLAVNSELVGKSLGLMNEQLNGGTALADEVARAQDTLGTELQRIARAWDASKQAVRGSNGALQDAAKFVADTANVLLGYDDAADSSRASTEAMALALKALAVPASYLAVTSLAGGITALSNVLPIATARQWLFNSAVSANPYVLAAAGIASVVTAFTLFADRGEVAIDVAARMRDVIIDLADETDRVADLDLVLERAIAKSDTRKELQTYTQLINSLEAAYIDVQKAGKDVKVEDIVALTNADLKEIEALGKQAGAFFISGYKTAGPTVAIGGAGSTDHLQDAAVNTAIANVDKVPAVVALELIDARIEELKNKVDSSELDLDFGPATNGALLDALSSKWDKIVKGYVARSKEAVEATKSQINAIELERQYLELDADERAIVIQSLQIEQDLRNAGSTQAEALASAYAHSALMLLEERKQRQEALREEQEFSAMQERIIAQRVNARNAIEDMNGAIRIEAYALSLSRQEQERVNAVLEYSNALRKSGSRNVLEETEAYERQLIALQDQRAWRQVADNIGNTVGQEITDLTLGLSSFNESVQNIGLSIGRNIIDKTVAQPIADSISTKLAEKLPDVFGSVTEDTAGATAAAGILEAAGVGLSASMTTGATTAAGILTEAGAALAAAVAAAAAGSSIPIPVPAGKAAKGAVVGSTGIVPMAKGGIITGPSLFPMANGEHILGGEAGTEAIAPLGRDSQGRLGVHIVGQSQSAPSIVMNVYTKDSGSFRESYAQLKDRLRRTRL